MIDGVSSDEYLNREKRRYIYDNQYEIPTRILLTRYDVDEFSGTSSECYVKYDTDFPRESQCYNKHKK